MFDAPIDLKLDVCPKPMITDWTHQMFRWYRHYKNNLLPYKDGLAEHPEIYLQAMELIESAIERSQVEKSKNH